MKKALKERIAEIEAGNYTPIKKKKSMGNPAWKKGVSGNPSGKKKGTKNTYTKDVKDAIHYAFKQMGGKKGVLTWAKKNETPFYKEVFALLPKDVNVEGDMNVNFTWEQDGKQSNGPL